MNKSVRPLLFVLAGLAFGSFFAGGQLAQPANTVFAATTESDTDPTDETNTTLNVFVYATLDTENIANMPPLALNTVTELNYDRLAAMTYRQLFDEVALMYPIRQYEVYSQYENGQITLAEGVKQINDIAHESGNGEWGEELFKKYADTAWSDGLTGYEVDMDKLNAMLDSKVVVVSHTDTVTTLETLIVPFKKTTEKTPDPPTTTPTTPGGGGTTTPETPVTPTNPVTTPTPTGLTGLPEASIAQKGEAVYALNAIYLYRHKTFKPSERRAFYRKVKRTERPMFVVTGYACSSAGRLRYQVRDVNHKRHTDGWRGYITANSAYVVPVYYAKMPKTRVLTVINRTGVNAYRRINLQGKVRNYKRGTHLRVTKIVHYHLTTRYILPDGRYITANKKLVIGGKY